MCAVELTGAVKTSNLRSIYGPAINAARNSESPIRSRLDHAHNTHRRMIFSGIGTKRVARVQSVYSISAAISLRVLSRFRR